MKKELDFQISESKKFARSSSFSLPTVSRYIKSLDVLCLEDHDAERQAASLRTPAMCHHPAVVCCCCCCSVAQLCPTLCDPMRCSMPVFPALPCLPEFAQTHVHWVGDVILAKLKCKKMLASGWERIYFRIVFQTWINSQHWKFGRSVNSQWQLNSVVLESTAFYQQALGEDN